MPEFIVAQDTAKAVGKRQSFTLSGSVTLGGSPVSRRVLIYKNSDTDVSAQTFSAADGSWSEQVFGNHNDRFRVVIIGQGTENSVVFEGVRKQ